MATWIRLTETLTLAPIFRSRSRSVSGMALASFRPEAALSGFFPERALARRLCRMCAKAGEVKPERVGSEQIGRAPFGEQVGLHLLDPVFRVLPSRSRIPRRVSAPGALTQAER